MKPRPARGFTLVEVMVALMIVALGLTALMLAVSSTARTSGYLRDKTLAQWIALNRISEVRLNSSSSNKFAQNTDTAEVNFAGRTWHYDTRYFDTSIATMQRVVVRVYAGDAKTKGNPLAESSGFLGKALAAPGNSNGDWTLGTVPAQGSNSGTPGGSGTSVPGTTAAPGSTGATGNPTVPHANPSPGAGQQPLQ